MCPKIFLLSYYISSIISINRDENNPIRDGMVFTQSLGQSSSAWSSNGDGVVISFIFCGKIAKATLAPVTSTKPPNAQVWCCQGGMRVTSRSLTPPDGADRGAS